MNAILTSPPQGISIENALNILRSLNFNILNVEELNTKKDIPNQETLIKDKETPFYDNVDDFFAFLKN